jgi:hypothetical protein
MKPASARKSLYTLHPKNAAMNPRNMETAATIWYASVTVKDMLSDERWKNNNGVG